MSALDPRQRANLRERLEHRARELREELLDSIRVSSLEHDAGAETDTRMAELERDAGELNRVNRALASVDGPGFGLCRDCGEPIAWARLEVEPEATRCAACTEHEERRASHPHASL